jgi:hypothetical protein
MAGVTNTCMHCGATLWDEETSYERCLHCNASNWNRLKWGSETPSTITVYTVETMQDEEGRRWKTIATVFNEEEAEKLKGNSGYKRIREKTVFTAPPLLRGIDVTTWQSLPRYPVDKVMKDKQTFDAIRKKLTDDELAFLTKHLQDK